VRGIFASALRPLVGGAQPLAFGGHLTRDRTRDRALSIAGRKCLTGVEDTLAHVQAPENCGGTRRSVKCREQDACTGVNVDGITPVADEKVAYTWTATVLRRSGGPVPGQCSRFFTAAVRLLQQQYDLASEED
jgi:hypothetical protein